MQFFGSGPSRAAAHQLYSQLRANFPISNLLHCYLLTLLSILILPQHLSRGLTLQRGEAMYARLLHDLIQRLLVLFLWLSIIGASPTPKRSTAAARFRFQPHVPRAPPPAAPLKPPSEAEYSYSPIVSSHYNLKFEKYPQWIKEHSEWLWKSRERHQAENEALRDYVSPYTTHFEAKKDGWWAWFDLGRLWRQFVWEVIPGWFSGRSLPPR